MDGNKKIKGIVFAVIVALSIAACTVKSPAYISLYLDNLISVNDTIQSMEMQPYVLDINMPYVFDTPENVEPEFPVNLRASEEKLNDTIDLLHKQVSEYQYPGSIESDALFNTKEKIRQLNDDNLYTSYKIAQLTEAKKDTINALNKYPDEPQAGGSLKTDTGYVIIETLISPTVDSLHPNHLTLQLIRAKDEQILMMQKQLNTLQNAGNRPQQTHILRGSEQVRSMGSQQPDHSTRQQLKSMAEQIQMLQNQLNVMQAAALRIPLQTPLIKEPEQAQPLDSLQLQAKNDTIQFLQSQMYDLQFDTPEKDSIFKEKELQKTQAMNELEDDQKTIDLFQSLQDTLLLLKSRILTMEEQILQDQDTQASEEQNELNDFHKTIIDTTLLIAYYELGKIKPLEEPSVLKQIEELCGNKNVTKITLSGYTDSSGSEAINKEITTLRLNYLSNQIIPWIPKEKVFFQNFGDTFASDMVISNERRIEIKIHIK